MIFKTSSYFYLATLSAIAVASPAAVFAAASDLATLLLGLVDSAVARANALPITDVAFASDSAVACLSLEAVEVEVARASPIKAEASEIALATASLFLPPTAVAAAEAAALPNAACARAMDFENATKSDAFLGGAGLVAGFTTGVGFTTVAVAKVEPDKPTREARVKAATLRKFLLIIFLAFESWTLIYVKLLALSIPAVF
ncbi:hypothetical protein LC605_11180 [Nostoc sp. CHAB 5836]|uniref:hypothetical protein n=1 Tax=Nostoc sp. CHAB 5836 TaxID=2780404 RepID=UPI001E29D24F|nr:hypothetical protein [Nostoc sp. CHAB 5836]MCC5615624.1 hypothetical protein [Nostoc sp. CHAB 5836]